MVRYLPAGVTKLYKGLVRVDNCHAGILEIEPWPTSSVARGEMIL